VVVVAVVVVEIVVVGAATGSSMDVCSEMVLDEEVDSFSAITGLGIASLGSIDGEDAGATS
jgi:hypothetical protein